MPLGTGPDCRVTFPVSATSTLSSSSPIRSQNPEGSEFPPVEVLDEVVDFVPVNALVMDLRRYRRKRTLSDGMLAHIIAS